MSSSTSIADLSQRLQSALDSNYNVVNMAVVVDVIGVLETAHITKEQLETTRLAKHINQLRRKTDDSMSRRLKNLLRKWREMVIPIVVAAAAVPATRNPAPPPPNHIATRQTTPNVSNGARPAPPLQAPQPPNRAVVSKHQFQSTPTTPQAALTPNQHSSSRASSSLGATLHAAPARSASSTVGGPISFTNLLHQAEANQTHHHQHPQQQPQQQGSRKRTIATALSPPTVVGSLAVAQLPRIPKRNRPPSSDTNAPTTNPVPAPLHLFGNTIAQQQQQQQPPQHNLPAQQLFQLPTTTYIDDGSNSAHSLLLLDDANSNPNHNSKRSRFNGPASPAPGSSSFGLPSDSESMSLLGMSSSSQKLTTKRDHKHHKKDKKRAAADARRDKPPPSAAAILPGVVAAATTASSSTSRTNITTNATTSKLNHLHNNASSATASSYIFIDAPNSLSSESSTQLLYAGAAAKTTTNRSQSKLNTATIQPTPPARGVPLRKHQSSELTFSGKFTKSSSSSTIDHPSNTTNNHTNHNTSTTIINIDSSSSSSSSSSAPAAALHSNSRAPTTTTYDDDADDAAKRVAAVAAIAHKARAFAVVSGASLAPSLVAPRPSHIMRITNATKYANSRSCSPVITMMDSSTSGDSSTLGPLLGGGGAKSGGESCSLPSIPGNNHIKSHNPNHIHNNTTSSNHQQQPQPPAIVPSAQSPAGGARSSPLAAAPLSGAYTAVVSDPSPKKRGRKKNGTSVVAGDRRSAAQHQLNNQPTTPNVLGNNATTTHHPFATSSSLLGLKNQIDSMRVGHNKVKTTKELLADLQIMRKQDTPDAAQLPPAPVGLGGGGAVVVVGGGSSATTSPALSGQRSRGPHSQTSSDTDSSSNDDIRSTTATPVSLLSTGQTADPLFGTTGGDKVTSAGGDAQHTTNGGADLRNVELEIAELRAQLPPIDRAAAERTEAALLADTTPVCTCTVVELAPLAAVAAELEQAEVRPPTPPPPLTPLPPIVVPAAVVAPRVIAPPIAPLPPIKKPPVRSIFDLDYDDDEDPLLHYKAATLLHNEKKLLREPTPPPTIAAAPEPPLDPPAAIERPVSPAPIAGPYPAPPPPPPPPAAIDPLTLLPRFEVLEDPQCAARQHFVDNKNRITAFHVAELHNAYVANVNGNWDDRTSPGPFDDAAQENGAEPPLYERVVPSYNHMCLDRIPKDLRHMAPPAASKRSNAPRKGRAKAAAKAKHRKKRRRQDAKKKGLAHTVDGDAVIVVDTTAVVVVDEPLKVATTAPPDVPVVVVKAKPAAPAKTIKYKIQGGGGADNSDNPATPPSTKLILKLSRQLTVDESANGDDEEFDEANGDSEFDEDYADDYDEHEDYDEDDEDGEDDDFEEVITDHPSMEQPSVNQSALAPHGFDCSDDMALQEPPQPMALDTGAAAVVVIASTESENHNGDATCDDRATAALLKCEGLVMPPNIRGLENRQENEEDDDDDQQRRAPPPPPPRRNGNGRESSESADEDYGDGYEDEGDDEDGDGESSSGDDTSNSSDDDEDEDDDEEEDGDDAHDNPADVVANDQHNNNNNDDIALPAGNNYLLPSFNQLDATNATGRRVYVPHYSPSTGADLAMPAPPVTAAASSSAATAYAAQQRVVDATASVLVTTEHPDGISRYREWHEVVMRRSYNNELLTILPYVVID